jgi:hypothetical protein
MAEHLMIMEKFKELAKNDSSRWEKAQKFVDECEHIRRVKNIYDELGYLKQYANAMVEMVNRLLVIVEKELGTRPPDPPVDESDTFGS